MPDGHPPRQPIRLADMIERPYRDIVEHAVFAIKEGFVVEHRVDRVVEQLSHRRGDECGDERVEIFGAVPLTHRFQRTLDSPATGGRQSMASRRLEHATTEKN